MSQMQVAVLGQSMITYAYDGHGLPFEKLGTSGSKYDPERSPQESPLEAFRLSIVTCASLSRLASQNQQCLEGKLMLSASSQESDSSESKVLLILEVRGLPSPLQQ